MSDLFVHYRADCFRTHPAPKKLMKSTMTKKIEIQAALFTLAAFSQYPSRTAAAASSAGRMIVQLYQLR